MSSYCSSIRHKAKTMAPFGKTVLLLLSLFLRIAYCNGDFKFQDLENLCQDYCRYNRINRIITKRHTLQLNKKKEDNDAPFLINDMPIDFINDIIQEFDIRRVSFIIDTSNTGVRKLFKSLGQSGVRVQVANGMKKLFHMSTKKDAYILLFDASKSYLEAMSRNGFLDGENMWFISTKNPEDIKTYNLSLHLNSMVYLYGIESDSTISLTETYRVADTLPITTIPHGVWTPQRGFWLTDKDIWERRSNLTGLVLQAVAVNDPPFTVVTKDKDNDKITFVGGIIGEIWNTIQQNLGFNIETRSSIDGLFGNNLMDGSFSGMLGMLHRNEVDIAIAGYVVSKGRADGAKFLKTVKLSRVPSWIKKPKEVDGSQTYVQPFTPALLIMAFLSFILSASVMTLINYIRSGYFQDQDFNLKLSLMSAVHGAFGQGTPQEPDSMSNKIILMLMFYGGYLLCASYSACLTSLLAVQKPILPFTNMKTMYENTDYRFLSTHGSAFHERLIQGDIYENKIALERSVLVNSFSKMRFALEFEEKIMLQWNAEVLDLITDDPCGLIAIPNLQYSALLASMVKHTSPYAHLLNYQITKIIESGLYSKLEQRWVPFLGGSSCNSGAVAKPLGIDEVYTIFILICTAILISGVLSIVENVLHIISRKKMSSLSLRKLGWI